MKLFLVTDAWHPQVNGVVQTLTQVTNELAAMGWRQCLVTPSMFRSVACPTYPEIRLSYGVRAKAKRLLLDFSPTAVHIATEGPLGFAVRRHCLSLGIPFSTAYHTRFPEYLRSKLGLPTAAAYAVLRRFHRPSSCVMVPTVSMEEELRRRGFGNLRQWTRGVDTQLFHPQDKSWLGLPRPVFMNVGRVSVEKNLPEFLDLDLPGSKVVVGDGPQLAEYRMRYPAVHFVGVKKGKELAKYFSAADVFVFPSKTDTFGLVLLEALASGVPVAALPVTGPRDVIGQAPVACLGNDLKACALGALRLSAQNCRDFALLRSWRASAEQFASNLQQFSGLETAA